MENEKTTGGIKTKIFVDVLDISIMPTINEFKLEYLVNPLIPYPTDMEILTPTYIETLGFKRNHGVASREFLKDDIKLINHYDDGFLYITKRMEFGVFVKHKRDLRLLME